MESLETAYKKSQSALARVGAPVKTCLNCGRNFYVSAVDLHWKIRLGKFCGIECYQQYRAKQKEANKDRKRAYQSEWRQRHPDYRKKRYEEHERRLWNIWESQGYAHHTSPRVIKSEEFVATQVLPTLGFTEILLTRLVNAYYPFDILAKDKEGRECGIEVTMKLNYHLDPRKYLVIKRYGMRVFVCHVKPDFSWYALNEITPNKTNSCCEGQFFGQLRAKG